MLLWGAGEEAGDSQGQAVLGLCPKGLPCLQGHHTYRGEAGYTAGQATSASLPPCGC